MQRDTRVISNSQANIFTRQWDNSTRIALYTLYSAAAEKYGLLIEFTNYYLTNMSVNIF